MKKIFWAEPFEINKSKKIISKSLEKTEISGSGKYVGIFERKLTKIYKSPVCVTSSGTTALQLAMLALDLKKDTEVIIPAYGYMAAANLSKNFNFKIKFCDVSEDTFCIDIEKLKKKVTSKTKVVIIIHTYGFSSEIDKIANFCKKNKIILIEDTAEAFGSLYKNRLLGTFGDLGTLSFHASKTITTGEGGAVIVNNKKYFRKIKLYRSHGIDKIPFQHIIPGFNFRLSSISCALGISQLDKFKKIKKIRRELYEYYLKNISNKKILLQTCMKYLKPVVWCFSIRINNPLVKKKIITNFKNKNIQFRLGFTTPSKINFFKNTKYKNSEKLFKEIICLPFHSNLTKKEINLILRIIHETVL